MRDLLPRALLGLVLLLSAGGVGCDLYNQSLPPKTDAGPDGGSDAESDAAGGDDLGPDGAADAGPDARPG